MHILGQMKGTYLLIMELDNEVSIMVGKRGVIDFKKACYVYVGSAFRGLDQRIRRHLQYEKKMHWHIDYFRPHISVIDIVYKENTIKEECTIAQAYERHFENIPGFGCSGCSCESHLFYGSSQEIMQIARNLGMKPYRLEANP